MSSNTLEKTPGMPLVEATAETSVKTPSVDPETDSVEKNENFLPFGPKLYAIVASLMLGVFCMALDNTIISVAIPKITDEFEALGDVGWYASAYLLTGCSFQLFFGKLYTLLPVKWVFLAALFVFEVGSLVCGVAPNSAALIVGRAISGLGSAGIFSGALITVANIVEVDRRPALFGAVGAVYGVASVAGPLMGGAFTDRVTWRWCFYINLPLGAATAVGIVFLLRIKKTQKPSDGRSIAQIIRSFDPVGTIIFVPSIICLLLALQWGGTTYAWSNGRVVACLVVFAITLVAFCGLQVYLKGDDATVPIRIITNRTIAAACAFGAGIGGSFFIFIYYIPIWFQAIKGTSAVDAGIYSLPLILAEIVAIGGSGALVTRFGQYAPFFIASSVIASIGAGLTTLFTVNTGQAAWAGFTFIYGFGIGLGFQQGGVAAQAVLPFADVAVGTTVVLFLQILGGAVFVSAAENLFTTRLTENIVKLGIEGLTPAMIIDSGATGFRSIVDPQYLDVVLVAYNDAIVRTFLMGLILSCISVVGAVFVEWKSIKGKKVAPSAA